MFYRIGKVNTFIQEKGEFPQKLTQIAPNKVKIQENKSISREITTECAKVNTKSGKPAIP